MLLSPSRPLRFARRLTACLSVVLLAFAAVPVAAVRAQATGEPSRPAAQQEKPPQAPRTGRPYETASPARKPATTSAPQSPSPVAFEDATARARLNFRHAASPTPTKYLLETMGGGVAVADFDGDGRLDVFFTNGARLSESMTRDARPDKRDPRFWNRIYRQKPDGTFEDVTERAGLAGEGYSMGAAVADYDGDGLVDLYVTAYGANTLYRNLGGWKFEDATTKAGVAASGWSSSAGWLDYDRDGRLDLYVARYMEWDFERGALLCGSAALRAFCHPDNFRGASPVLFRQKEDGTFEDVSARARIADPEGKGLGVAFSDFDDDGHTDIFQANDNTRQFLFRNNGDGTFEDVALTAGVGYDENGKSFAGMGADAADFDGDGRTDIFVTALSNETYPLFRNDGDLSFTYATATSGVAAITMPFSGWGTRVQDFDADGLKDIFVAQGHVLDTIEKSTGSLSYRQPLLLMRNTGSGFVNVSASAGLSSPLAARGAAFGDLDDDGFTDVVVSQVDGPPVLLRNVGAKNNWLGLALEGAGRNRQALGARIKVTDETGRVQTYEATTAGSYLSSNDPRVVVGLGRAKSVRSVEVRWPGGRTQIFRDVPVNAYTTLKER